MCQRLFLDDSMKLVALLSRGVLSVGFVPTPSPNGVTLFGISSSKEKRVPFLEQACALLVAGDPAALSPLPSAIKGGTLQVSFVTRIQVDDVAGVLCAHCGGIA